MRRPCFLVIDREYPGNISTRKLVLETAKFNVITAYDGPEGIELLRRFPAVDAIVLHAQSADYSCEEICKGLKEVAAEVPIVVTSEAASTANHCSIAEYHIPNFDPGHLLETLRGLVPEASHEIELGEQTI
jgi:DNA-binding response OmpR family regulator